MTNLILTIDDEGGGLRPIAAVLGPLIVETAHRSCMSLPIPPRLPRLGRDLTGKAFRPVVAWRNPAFRLSGSTR